MLIFFMHRSWKRTKCKINWLIEKIQPENIPQKNKFEKENVSFSSTNRLAELRKRSTLDEVRDHFESLKHKIKRETNSANCFSFVTFCYFSWFFDRAVSLDIANILCTNLGQIKNFYSSCCGIADHNSVQYRINSNRCTHIIVVIAYEDGVAR